MTTPPRKANTLTIDLQTIPATVINLPDEKKRRRAMGSLLKTLGIPHRFSDGVSHLDGKIRNAAAAHEAAFRLAGPPPFMVLEDDLEYTRDTTVFTDVPACADLVYLGISTAGCFPRSSDYTKEFGHRAANGLTLASHHNETFARLHSMISAHAILFLTPKAVAAYAEAQQLAIKRKIPLDVAYAYAMDHLSAYAVRLPAFRESMALQNWRKRSDKRALYTATPLVITSAGERRTGLRKRYEFEAEAEPWDEGRLRWRMVAHRVLAEAPPGSDDDL